MWFKESLLKEKKKVLKGFCCFYSVCISSRIQESPELQPPIPGEGLPSLTPVLLTVTKMPQRDRLGGD